jgi:hypothetical protein
MYLFTHPENYYKANFPTDSDFTPCAYAANEKYPMVYFPDVNDAALVIHSSTQRVCVSVCPNQGDKELICKTNSKVPSCKLNNIYQTSADWERLGGFCGPTDGSLKDKLIDNSGIKEKWTFLNTYDTIRLSLLLALGIGLVWFILVQAIPHAMSAIAIFLSVLVSISIGVLFFVDSPRGF